MFSGQWWLHRTHSLVQVVPRLSQRSPDWPLFERFYKHTKRTNSLLWLGYLKHLQCVRLHILKIGPFQTLFSLFSSFLKLPMIGIEPSISGIGSDRSTNCTTATVHFSFRLQCLCCPIKTVKGTSDEWFFGQTFFVHDFWPLISRRHRWVFLSFYG